MSRWPAGPPACFGIFLVLLTASVTASPSRAAPWTTERPWDISVTVSSPAATLSNYDYLVRLGRVLFGEPERFHDVEACGTSRALERYLEGRYRAQSWRLTTSGDEAGSRSSDDSGVENRDGIWIVEGDDTILALDNPTDLKGRSVRFSPSGSGYDVPVEALQYDSEIGTEVLPPVATRTYASVVLTGAGFPQGGNVYSTLWVGSDFGIRTGSSPHGR